MKKMSEKIENAMIMIFDRPQDILENIENGMFLLFEDHSVCQYFHQNSCECCEINKIFTNDYHDDLESRYQAGCILAQQEREQMWERENAAYEQYDQFDEDW